MSSRSSRSIQRCTSPPRRRVAIEKLRSGEELNENVRPTPPLFGACVPIEARVAASDRRLDKGLQQQRRILVSINIGPPGQMARYRPSELSFPVSNSIRRISKTCDALTCSLLLYS